MKQTIYFALLSIVFLSCSSDNESSSSNFFNLNTGNLRVYKRFASTDGVTFVEGTRIDSVRTTGDTIIEGITYEKFLHKIFVNSVQMEAFTECLRENQNGHLIDQWGTVLHPGYDSGYNFISPVIVGGNVLGDIHWTLGDPITEIVEGQSYNIYPFNGHFIPGENQEEQYVFNRYAPNIGLVVMHFSAIWGSFNVEDRLIYSEVN